MKLPHFAVPKLSSRDLAMVCVGILVALLCFGIGIFVRHQQVPLASQSSNVTVRWIPATVKRWQGPIVANAKKYNIDPDLLAIIMTMESGGYSRANSGVAQGLMQITPPTATDIASKYLKKPVKNYNLYDPNTSIEFGAAYLAHLRDIFGSVSQGPSWTSTVELVAAGYNGGPGAANKLELGKGLEDTQTVVYSRDAFNMWRERNSSKSPTFDRWKERGGTTLLDAAKAEMH